MAAAPALAPADVVLEVLPQQPPQEPAVPFRGLAVARVVQYLYLASLWVACAGVAASAIARRASGVDSSLTWTFIKVSIGSLAFPALVILVSGLRLLRATCAAGFRPSLRTSAKGIQIARKVFGALTWKVVLPVVLVLLVTFLFFLLMGAGVMVFEGLLPVEKSQKKRVGYALFDTGVLGAMAMFGFVIIPSCVFMLWKSK
ncbi:hypothetical protein HU200_005208 [Digitaria exilis]|uniref:Uncharacterized protein n=1 Tax=Digitaria exilis TaxID=1010633 RepID=A0A835KWK2_9POAL|nr:hypothetical protein HU200_005363 [Digitaria exilis]KAF8772824.1 hypothetical protein HU200_005208 [Digitaria exilis]CAB3480966.1 unnamed protein product [Digitaria exilis]